jgi:hypothetical protein
MANILIKAKIGAEAAFGQFFATLNLINTYVFIELH